VRCHPSRRARRRTSSSSRSTTPGRGPVARPRAAARERALPPRDPRQACGDRETLPRPHGERGAAVSRDEPLSGYSRDVWKMSDCEAAMPRTATRGRPAPPATSRRATMPVTRRDMFWDWEGLAGAASRRSCGSSSTTRRSDQRRHAPPFSAGEVTPCRRLHAVPGRPCPARALRGHAAGGGGGRGTPPARRRGLRARPDSAPSRLPPAPTGQPGAWVRSARADILDAAVARIAIGRRSGGPAAR
jgi:hypothetical protein